MTIRKDSLEERPPAFTYRGGNTSRTLCCDEVEVERLARRFGTPALCLFGNRDTGARGGL